MTDKNLLSTLDGRYWNSGARSDRQMNFNTQDAGRNRAFLYDNSPQKNSEYQFQREYDRTDEILQKLNSLTATVQSIAQNHVSMDAFHRFLIHFEQSQAELRALIVGQQQQEEEPSIKEEVVFEQFSVPQPQSVAFSTSFTEPLLKHNHRDAAQTLVSLGDRPQSTTRLHEYQTSNSSYYWIAFNKSGRQALQIGDDVSEEIEHAYQRLLKFGPAIPRHVQVGEVVINFDSREGTYGGLWVTFNRVKK